MKEIATFFEYALNANAAGWEITRHGEPVKSGGLEIVAMFVEIPYGLQII
jgi:N-acyl-L-homoserine lactone synthetase